MPTIARSALVSHSAAEMYGLVRDIGSYPTFLPWCQAATVAEQSEEHQVASITIDRRMQGARFTTRNRLVVNEAIHMSLVDGPFRQLNGVWKFKAIDEDACRVELEIEFEFKSRIFAALMGTAFSKICDTMVAAFVKRADDIQS
ncbi:type II toxin-antitoxin system RatA family toxin [Granulosicoccus antarcticus]|uniref:Persistence and stress-resistance toxin PasT n=1 Tax=Granulosicoccus antarcticus IMCC3135 TaxID=1192854 RepID=A0A2Z2NML6_9GAMM|nr:type II toxin-antitoxin system RatA family toxin [Granulosicoccus antarcticus]ASJ72459.1 Persistence and stress-resistance toxin PasT [Granulosicoccus antarcticus IMCC3135]